MKHLTWQHSFVKHTGADSEISAAPTETGFQSRAQLWKALSGHDLK